MTHDPRLRGAGERALPQREDAGPHAPLHRRGGGRRRRLLGAAPRRLDHLDAPRPRPLPREGRRRRRGCSRSCSARRPGYCRGKGGSMHIADHENGNLGANAIVGGSAGIATGAAFSAKRRGTDQVAVCFFGEGALGQGLALRGDEHGRALEAAGHLRLREQPLQRVHALPRGDGRRHPRRGRRRSGSRRERSTARTSARSTRRPRELVERARDGDGPAFLLCEHLPLPRPPRRRRRPRLLPLEGRGGAVARRARPDRAASARWLGEQKLADAGRPRAHRGRGARRDRGGRRSSRSTRRSPTRAR